MRVVIVGGGFAGYHAARTLLHMPGERTEVVVLNPTDYFLYLPLLPEVAAGIVNPRHIAVSIPDTLRGVRLVLGTATAVDFETRTVAYTDPEDREGRLGYDRLILAAGSVNKLLPVPGVAENAHGFRGLPEALYLRDHVTRQIELAAATGDAAERTARCTFVVVGAGYTGTEVAAQGPAFTAALARRHPELSDQPIRWLLLDVADRVLPGLDHRLGETADRVLRGRGVEVRMKSSVDRADANGVTLTTGESVPTRTLVWCVGVRPDPLVSELGLETAGGRLVVTPDLRVPGHDDVFACGDAAAVPDLTRPGELTPMTAQHAQRQGKLAGRNAAASLRSGRLRRYRHHDLGFAVDLGAGEGAADPLHVPLAGRPARLVTRGYHLLSLPATGCAPPRTGRSKRWAGAKPCSSGSSVPARSRWTPLRPSCPVPDERPSEEESRVDVAGRSDLRASAATGLRVGAALAHANVANRLESSPRDTPVRADSAQLSAARQQPGEDATQLADEALPHVARPRANLVTVDERPPSRQVVGALLRDS